MLSVLQDKSCYDVLLIAIIPDLISRDNLVHNVLLYTANTVRINEAIPLSTLNKVQINEFINDKGNSRINILIF